MHILQPIIVLEGITSFFSFLMTIIPPFLGTTYTRLIHELSDIGYIIPSSSNLTTPFLTTSFLAGLSLR